LDAATCDEGACEGPARRAEVVGTAGSEIRAALLSRGAPDDIGLKPATRGLFSPLRASRTVLCRRLKAGNIIGEGRRPIAE